MIGLARRPACATSHTGPLQLSRMLLLFSLNIVMDPPPLPTDWAALVTLATALK